jgi:hypothetical protein
MDVDSDGVRNDCYIAFSTIYCYVIHVRIIETKWHYCACHSKDKILPYKHIRKCATNEMNNAMNYMKSLSFVLRSPQGVR